MDRHGHPLKRVSSCPTCPWFLRLSKLRCNGYSLDANSLGSIVMFKPKSSLRLNEAEIENRAEEISLSLSKDRALLRSYSQLLRELGHGEALIEKRIVLDALARQWIVLDREYRHFAKAAKNAHKYLKFMMGTAVIIGAVASYATDQPANLFYVLYFSVLIMLYINLTTTVKAAEDGKVEAYWRKNDISFRIERETGCDLFNISSDTSCLPIVYPRWPTFQELEIERISNALQIKWCRRLVNFLDIDNNLGEVDYSKAEDFSDRWAERVFSDQSILIDK